MFIYNFALLLGSLIVFPKWLIQKKYQGNRLKRLGFLKIKTSSQSPVIWIHMVSMGETRAMIPIYKKLCEKYPDAAFFVSSTTKTGHEEAKRNFPKAVDHFFLPLDFSWVMKRLARLIKPDILILSESDFWYHMCKSVKDRGGKVLLLNGKISETSLNRFAKFPFFTRKLFDQIDHLCVQHAEYAHRFQRLQIPKKKLSITGNLKLAIPTPQLSNEERRSWQQQFGLRSEDRVITLGSTHEGEEELLLSFMPSDRKILLVPRHPERFEVVRKHLKLLSNPNIVLVDRMGVLPICYQLSELAIVGGSFIPGIGGHNIFEPIQAKIPVIFGPYMESQKELVCMILEAHAGIQTPFEGLASVIKNSYSLKENVLKLAAKGIEVEENIWKIIQPFLIDF